MLAIQIFVLNKFVKELLRPKITELQFATAAPACKKVFVCPSSKGELLFYVFGDKVVQAYSIQNGKLQAFNKQVKIDVLKEYDD